MTISGMNLGDIVALCATGLWLPLSVVVGVVAHKRGRFGYGWFLLSVIVTPFIVGPILLVLPRRPRAADASPKDIEPQTRKNGDQAEITASSRWRAVFIVGAVTMLALWGWSLVPPIQNWGNPHEDGFSYVPAFWASLMCLPVAFYLLAGAIIAHGRPVARARNALVIGGGILVIVVGFLIFQHIANAMGGLGLG